MAQMAYIDASLKVVVVEDVNPYTVNSITWFPDKEVIHVALVGSTLPGPLLCGENHLFSGRALSDNSNNAVTFCTLFMSQFINSLDKHEFYRTFTLTLPALSLENQIINSCLPESQSSAVSANFTVYLILRAASIGFLANDLFSFGRIKSS